MVQPLEVADRLSRGGRIHELSSGGKALGMNRVYRLFINNGSRVLKIYGTQARERRERHALDAISDVEGLPTVVDRGADGELHWALFADAGKWSIGTLPENPGLSRKAGEILRNVHHASAGLMSNLSRGIDQDWVAVDFVSTFRRLERYRRKIGISAELIEQARQVRPPFASEPRSSHTNPEPENLIVDDLGNVTLINWEWATLAPPEWDLSKAAWLIGIKSGPSASRSLMEGYGRALDPIQLDRWTVYHAGMMLVFEAENTLRSGTGGFEYLVAELQRAITGARGPAPAEA